MAGYGMQMGDRENKIKKERIPKYGGLNESDNSGVTFGF